MKMSARAVALCCAVLAAAGASAYTVDCNHEYTDCDTELSKLTDEYELPTLKTSTPLITDTTYQPSPTTTSSTTTVGTTEKAEASSEREVPEEVKPQPRLLNLNVDELQNFANALHNQTDKSIKKLTDLSDVTLDDDDEEPPRTNENQSQNKDGSDKFYSNLHEPFRDLMSSKSESSETEMCKENEIAYKVGEKIDRGCDEICECIAGGIFDCSPRCKHPYIRRGRRLNDPLCFESPVDVCCSIIACATGNGDPKISKLEVCKYNNETYPVGVRWYIGCESSCICEANSVVTCKPRCKTLPPSDKCINVQDPNDACCEVQVCDVSQDVHEITDNVTTSTTTASTPHRVPEALEEEKVSAKRPLVLAEPIGSIKVLQNNSVQVNLMHLNNSEDPIHLLLSEDGGRNFQDVELKYSNLILNLEGGKDYILKTKETGTKFNFTITSSDVGPEEVMKMEEHENVSKSGCWEDGRFYEVGEEFKIGCTELCECTAPDTRECVALVCPNHVGLEIMSKGCVKWAPSPPAQPPNCCPRSARCLSDGTCHYNGIPVPNWSEVPISLTGCEQRCFCENGDLDCQEVCSPLPPVPPQTLRCPPKHRPAAVNISDEDCCKQWGCVPIKERNGSQSHSMPVISEFSEATNYVTPISPILPVSTQVLPEPPEATDSMINFYKHYAVRNPFKSHLKFFKTQTSTPEPYTDQIEDDPFHDNVTEFSAAATGSYKTTQTESSIANDKSNWPNIFPHSKLTGPISFANPHPMNALDWSSNYTDRYNGGDNITSSSISNIGSSFKNVQVEPHVNTANDYWPNHFSRTEQHDSDPIPKTQTVPPVISNDHTKSFNSRFNVSIFPVVDTGSFFETVQEKLPVVPNNYYWPLSADVKEGIEPKVHKTDTSVLFINHTERYDTEGNITDFASSPFKTIQGELMNIHTTFSKIAHSHPEKQVNFVLTDNKVRNIPHSSHVLKDQFSDYQDRSKSIFKSHEVVKKLPSSSSVKDFNYFVPTHQKSSPPLPSHLSSDDYLPKVVSDTFVTPTSKYFFQPIMTNNSDYMLTKSDPVLSNSFQNLNPTYHTSNKPSGKHVTILKSKILNVPKPIDAYDGFLAHDTKTHVLTKLPSPYETVLLRAVQNPKHAKTSTSSQKLNSLQVPSKTYSAIDLEHLLNQMEVQSEVNRNLGRSADKNQGSTAGHSPQMPPDFPSHVPHASSFLPTIPPELHYPQEDDYDQNNIHHPAPPEQSGLPGLPGLPPGLQVPSNFGDINKKLSVISIESDSATSIKMLLGLPPVLVGLRGSVDLRYTDKADEDVSHWYSQVFAPADEVLTTPRLEFRLTGLKPSTTYKVRGKLYLHNLPVSPESDTYSVRTHDLPAIGPVEEKRKEINSGLTVVEVNDTTAHVSWKHFSEDELQFIDGIQVRYRPVGTPIYSMTELLHHSRSAAELHDLRPGSRYEASLVLIPPPRAITELHDPGRIEFTTAPYIDPYNWTVVIEARSVGAEAAELTWHGVPSPAERWVRVYRAAHACGDQSAGKEHDEFRLAARDQPPSVTLSGLVPDTRCRVWLELFLSNGKVKTSNVLEINTKSLDMDNPIDNEIEASGQSGSARGRPRGDYYTALVGVGVVAALGALTSLLLLLVVVRRHRPRSVPITPVPTAPRESSLPPYDNPAYKLELQQETMDL